MISLLVSTSTDKIVEMSDVDLRIAIAKEYQLFDRFVVHPSGAIIGGMNGVITERPVFIPDWPNDPQAVSSLEKNLRDDGMGSEYAARVGSFGPNPSSRQRTEAILAAVRALKN